MLMMAALKSLSDYSNISVILMLASVNCFSYQGKIFLVLRITRDFLKLKPGHFEYYVMTLNLIQIFCFSRPPLILKQQRTWGTACYCQLGVEFQVPHSASELT